MSEETPQSQNSQDLEIGAQAPAGSNLLKDEESYKSELQDEELNSVSGGTIPLVVTAGVALFGAGVADGIMEGEASE